MFEYEKCFQPLQEKGASRHLIMTEDPNLTIAVDSLVKSGVLVGQGEMLTQDVVYFLNPERQNIVVHPLKPNGEPLYVTPEERLARPTDVETKMRNGRKAII